MKASPVTSISRTLGRLGARLDQQAAEIARLRAALDVQFKRIAHMQAELDVLPTARRRRKAVRDILTGAVSDAHGNGHRQP